ncbi:hypothetical protein BKA70DRAFT_1414306 [Coprinopsis sp. MPI-PUGE-AT-0042]|nr:hypothetical protein BKA70DRAFT_1414306 [Coprinopsis sp. MPI-PUGE-AT-0042]
MYTLSAIRSVLDVESFGKATGLPNDSGWPRHRAEAQQNQLSAGTVRENTTQLNAEETTRMILSKRAIAMKRKTRDGEVGYQSAKGSPGCSSVFEIPDDPVGTEQEVERITSAAGTGVKQCDGRLRPDVDMADSMAGRGKRQEPPPPILRRLASPTGTVTTATSDACSTSPGDANKQDGVNNAGVPRASHDDGDGEKRRGKQDDEPNGAERGQLVGLTMIGTAKENMPASDEACSPHCGQQD